MKSEELEKRIEDIELKLIIEKTLRSCNEDMLFEHEDRLNELEDSDESSIEPFDWFAFTICVIIIVKAAFS